MRELQIITSGPRDDTLLLSCDDGVGQAPRDFADTFLSLLRGNKNDVRFVQGKYNMGGAGAIAFCGDRRFQLVASKRYDGSSPLGFTLPRGLNVSLTISCLNPPRPFLTVDNNERFPDNEAPVQAAYDLKRRLEGDNQTLKAEFSIGSTTPRFGELGVAVDAFTSECKLYEPERPKREPRDAPPFDPKRYPSIFWAKAATAPRVA